MTVLPMVNLDDVLSTFYARLNRDPEFRGMVRSITKGRTRPAPPPGKNRPENPSCTVFLLTAPMDPETGRYTATIIVNVFVDAHPSGEEDILTMGRIARRIQELFNRAHLPDHPAGQISEPGIIFDSIHVREPLFLPGDAEGEHTVSIYLTVNFRAEEV